MVPEGRNVMNLEEAYDELIRRSREHSLLASCSALLGWDEQTYMPRGGVEHRANQMALLAGLHHEQATDPRIGELLGALEGSSLVADPTRARRGERPRAAPRLRTQDSAAPDAGRGARPDHVGGPAGVDRRPPRQRLRPVPAVAGEDRRS